MYYLVSIKTKRIKAHSSNPHMEGRSRMTKSKVTSNFRVKVNYMWSLIC